MAPTWERSSQLELVPLAQIRPPANPSRTSIDPDRLGELADSMAAEGLHQPIGLRGPFQDGTWEIIWGHRRYLAAQSLGWPAIKAMLYPPDYEPMMAQLHENLQRENLTPLEEAKACQALHERGYSRSQIARQLRKSDYWVTTRLALLDTPADVQQAVHEKRIPLGVAQALAQIDHEPYRTELLAEAERTGATIGVVNVWVAEYAKDRERLIRNLDAIPEIIRRAQEQANFTECQACNARTPWAEIYPLRLCQHCYSDVSAAILSVTTTMRETNGRGEAG